MLEELLGFKDKHPKVTYIIVILLTIVLTKVIQNDPLERRDFAQYRLVYKDVNQHGYQGYTKGCGDTDTGYAYFIETSGGKWYSNWDFSGKCNLTKSVAKNRAENLIREMLTSRKSEEVVYNAYLEKEDVVTFEEQIIK